MPRRINLTFSSVFCLVNLQSLYFHGVDTKRPKHKTQKQNTQDFKMSKVTKRPNLQNIQMSKITKCSKFSKNVKIIKCLITT